MHSKKFLILITTILILGAISSFGVAQTHLDGFELVSENEFLELYYLPKNAEIAVRHKEDDSLWFSNPPDREEMETKARGSTKARLGSQLVLTYYVANQQMQMDSFNDSISHDQFSSTPLENGLRVDYEFGKMWNDRDYLPTIISEEQFNNEILDKISNARDRKFIRDLYALFSLEEGYDSGEDYSIMNVDLDELLGDYGLKVSEPRFRVADKRRVLQEYLVLVKDAMKYDSIGQVKAEEISGLYETPTLLLKWNAMQWDIEDAIELMKEIGFRPENTQTAHESYNVNPPYPDLRRFKASIEYHLEGDNLVVKIPSDSISFPDKVHDLKTDKVVSYPLTSISLLPYFGAANIEEEGYMFIPDGSGALIYFNSQKPTATPYSRSLYGLDYSTQPIAEYSAMLKEQLYMPVFGSKKGDRAYLAIIEESDAAAKIEAVVSDMRDSYNRVWSSFDIRPAARVSMEAEGELIHLRTLSILMYQSRTNNKDIVVRYAFLPPEESNYSGMARLYREYLAKKHDFVQLKQKERSPLVIDIVGSIDRIRPVLGVPTNVVEPITTHDQTMEIVETLLDHGIDDIKLRYMGWLKGGIRHVFPTKAKLEKAVGTTDSWTRLSKELENKGIEFFPNVDFMRVHRNQLADKFIEFRDAPRFLSRSSSYVNTYNIATYQPIDNKRISLLSPSRLGKTVSSFMDSYNKMNIKGLALGDLGLDLYTDYRTNPKSVVDRQTAKEIVVEQGDRLVNQGKELMVAGANAYMLPYAKYVVESPMYSRSTAILNQTVPFYQMVLSGYKGYAGESYTLSDNSGKPYLLKLIETGTIPFFTLSGVVSSVMKNTDYDYFYSTYYEDQIDEIVAIYNEVNDVLGGFGAQIVDHEILAPNVSKTVYETGRTVVVNYNSDAYRMPNGLVVPAVGYLVIK